MSLDVYSNQFANYKKKILFNPSGNLNFSETDQKELSKTYN